MEVYRRGCDVENKADNSPVTIADRLAEEIILRDLQKIAPDIPVIAEEAAARGNLPQTSEYFFLFDPLDGTKEFIRGSDEFTVNIALIKKGKPVFGLVYAPALKKLYVTPEPGKAVSTTLDPDTDFIKLADMQLQPLATRPPSPKGLNIVASKSHMTEQTSDYIKQFTVQNVVSAGSSLKFCLLAEGQADLYPRFGPTMEWDTAAGHAVLLSAGGKVLRENGEPLDYGKTGQNYLNPFFIAWGQPPRPDILSKE